MTRKLAIFALLACLSLTGCDKVKSLINRKKPTAQATPAAATPTVDGAAPAEINPSAVALPPDQPDLVPAATPAPVATSASVPAATAPKPVVDTHSSVMVLCYHNIEDGSKMKALTITIAQFEKEMQALKDNGFSVIPMQDFLAWRRNEKSIPAKSCIITIDDGWVSGYTNAWPVLKKHGYPFTMFIYINYVGTGGKSLSWDQLAEMRDAGVDIQSHTYSHADLRSPTRPGSVDKRNLALIEADIKSLGHDGWMRKEIAGSKKVLEERLGIRVNALAYPFGNFNQKARDFVKEAGYEAAFTVYGQRLTHGSPSFDLLGRYAIEAAKPIIFQDALAMIGGGAGGGEPVASSNVAQLAAASMVTQPMDGETITNPKPIIKANLATVPGEINPSTLVVRVSGVGAVAAKYDAASKSLTAPVLQPLKPGSYSIIVSADAGGQKMETRWTFTYSATGKAASPADAPLPPRK